MLVITRHPGQSIHIGDDIVIDIISVHRSIVKIGIDAPEDVKIYRDEIAPSNVKKKD